MTTFLPAAPVMSCRSTEREELSLLDRPGGSVRTTAVVEVPGCWTMQGVGDPPQYTNIQMPFPGPPPHVPQLNPTGVYRRRVRVPAEWADRRIVLHVGGAETVLQVEVGGRFVGMGTDSRLPQEFDDELVRAGDDIELTLTVVRWGAATYLEDQDHWHHAGLHRSVVLYSTPTVHLLDVHADADWDPSTGAGHLTVRATTGEAHADGAVVRVTLDGTAVGESLGRWEHTDTFVNAYRFAGRGATVTATLPDITPWSAERPGLHDLHVALVGAGGDVLDQVALRVGFRRVEICGHELLVNGRAVLIKGVNRHDHDMRRGKAVTRESIRRDVELMKAHHFNALRTSHYPSDPFLYEVCDELGMYVVDEADVESHAYLRSLTDSPEWTAPIIERVTRMAQRDKNHPSVIMWSLGNESGSSPVFDAAAAWLRAYDPGRPVHYENGYLDGTFAGLTPPEAWREAAAGQRRDRADVPGDRRPPPLGDRGAAGAPADHVRVRTTMNNSCGTSIATGGDPVTPGLQGGFVWDWVDQALVQLLPDGPRAARLRRRLRRHPQRRPVLPQRPGRRRPDPHPSLHELAQIVPAGADRSRRCPGRRAVGAQRARLHRPVVPGTHVVPHRRRRRGRRGRAPCAGPRPRWHHRLGGPARGPGARTRPGRPPHRFVPHP